MPAALDRCARGLLDTAPLIMRAVRKDMRSRRAPDLSIPQFRSLAFIHRHHDVSLSRLAEHLGLRLPSTSKLIDGLVGKSLVTRQPSLSDRRCVQLALTRRGAAMLATARAGTQAHLTEILQQLSASELEVIGRALTLLNPLFAAESSTEESSS